MIREFYDAARGVLKHELLNFDQNKIEIIAESFANVIKIREYTCYACAIMPDHVHLVIRKHRDKAEEMIANLQNASRTALQEQDHPIWGGPGCRVFLIPEKILFARFIMWNKIRLRFVNLCSDGHSSKRMMDGCPDK